MTMPDIPAEAVEAAAMGDVIVCRPETFWLRRIRQCPTCHRRRRFVAFDQLWYGPTWTCCRCGDAWTADGRLPRPFKPRWRRESATWAREHWSLASGDRAEHMAWLAAQIAEEVGHA